MAKNRIEWIDLAKGLVMLLVILGHTLPYQSHLRVAIYSFHMPLFFVLSCVTFRFSKNNGEFVAKTEKAFVHLILPALFTYLLTQFSWPIITYHNINTLDMFKRFLAGNIVALIFSSGGNVNLLSGKIYGIDVSWFLVVLFFARTFFDYLHLKLSKTKLILCCILLSCLGFVFSKIQWLPFSFDIVLLIMPLLYIGSNIYRINPENRPIVKFFWGGVWWSLTLLVRYRFRGHCFELATRSYPLFPLCLITAIAGTLMVIELSVVLMKFKAVMKPVMYLGKNSLYMLMIHAVERYWLTDVWRVSENAYVNFGYRLLLDIGIFVVVMAVLEGIKRIRKLG